MYQLLGWTAALGRERIVGWLLAAAFFLIALRLRLMIEPLSGYPFLAFFPAVILATFISGWIRGTVVAVAGGVSAWYLGGPDVGSIGGAAVQGIDPTALLVYALVTALNIALIEALVQATDQMASERSRATQAAEEQKTMFHELQHRVANNMQFVSSLLSLQARRIADAKDAKAAFADATRRLDMLSRIHRRLYDPANARRDFGQIVEEICRDLLDATGAQNVVCRVNMPQVELGMDRLTSLSMIITELLTNAIKHAFADGRPGSISICLMTTRPGRYMLEMRDNGLGWPAGVDPMRTDTLGMRIVQSLVQRLNGTLSVSGGDGTVAKLEFAA